MKNIIFFVLVIFATQLDGGWDWFKKKEGTKRSDVAMVSCKNVKTYKESYDRARFEALLAEVKTLFKISQQKRPYGYIPHKDK